MTEFWFDLSSGDLLVGVGAAALRIEAAGPDVVELPELITGKDFPIRNGDYAMLDVKDWQPDDYRTWGQWVLRVVDQARQPEPLSMRHIERVRALGLGPSKARLGVLSTFKEAIGALPAGMYRQEAENDNVTNCYFKDMPDERFVRHAAAVAKKTGSRPTRADYRAARRPGVPGALAIIDRFGSIAALNEYIGYPDYSEWDKDDFIQYGLNFLAANDYNTSLLVTTVLDIPARAKRGPWPTTVSKYFDDWAGYKTAVLDAFRTERTQKTDRYRAMTAIGRLPVDFEGLHDAELDQVAARYLVIRDVVPQLDDKAKVRWALGTPSGQLISRLRSYNNVLNTGDIESAAVTHGVFNDLWPPAYVPYLHVTPQDHKASLRRSRDTRTQREAIQRQAA